MRAGVNSVKTKRTVEWCSANFICSNVMAEKIGTKGALRLPGSGGVTLHRWAVFLEVAAKLEPAFLDSFNEHVTRQIQRPDLTDSFESVAETKTQEEEAIARAAPFIERWLAAQPVELTDPEGEERAGQGRDDTSS